MEKMVSVHCKVQPNLYKKLKDKTKELNVSMGAIVRIALSEYLKED